MTRVGVVLILALALPAEALAQTGRIGAVAAVNRDMRGTPPGLEGRLLLLGDDVVTDERIETSDIGSGHLLFVDQTSLAVAPNSDIVLDKYVFDPDRQAGDVALSLTRGALRFIGGRITEQNAAVIRTPTATIGIRGSGAIIELTPECEAGPVPGCRTNVTVLSADEVTVTRHGDGDGDGLDDGPGGEAGIGIGDVPLGTSAPPANPVLSSVTLGRPGAVAVATPDGTEFTGLARAEDLAPLLAAFEGARDGGSPAVATTPAATVRQAGQDVAAVNSQAQGGAGAPPQQPGGAADVDGETAGESSPADEGDFTFASTEDNSLAEELENDPDEFLAGTIPSPDDLADLTGLATYSGAATGVLADTSITGGDPNPTPIQGSFAMTYDFDLDRGALDLDVMGGVLSVDVAGETANDPTFRGSDEIFGGPNTVSADGNFRFEGADPAGAVEGNFEIDLVTESQRATGEFGGPRD